MYSVASADVLETRELLCQLWASNLQVRGQVDEKLRWFYCDGPHGPGRAFVLNAHDGAIGCAGLGVRRFLHQGHPLRVALFADLAVDPAHRSALPAVTLLRSIQDTVEHQFDLGYGFPNDKAAAVYRRAGYRELGQRHRYVRVLRSRSYLRGTLGRWLSRPAAAIADAALATLSRARVVLARDFALTWLDELDSGFDRLWQAARDAYPFACERSAAFLRWRFARDPHRVVALVSRRTDHLRAYAVVRPGPHDSVELVDVFGHGERELDALLALLVPAIGRLGFAAIAVRFLGNPRVVQVLHGQGFVQRGEATSVVVCGGRSAAALRLRETDDWYLTGLDDDN